MEPLSPLNYTRKFFGDKATELEDLDLIRSFVKKKGISGDTPIDQIVAQMEENAFGRLQQQNQESSLKNTRQFFGENSFGIDDDTLALSYAKKHGLSLDTPIADVFREMEEKARVRVSENDISGGGDRIPLDGLPGAINFLREQDSDGRSGFNFGAPDIELDLEGVTNYLRPQETRPNFIEKVGQEVLSLDFLSSDGARELARGVSTLQADDKDRQRRLNEIDRQLNNPDAIASFVNKVERFQRNPELFSEEDRQKLFNAAKLFETTNVSFRDETSGLAGFVKELPKTIVHPVARGVNQMLGTAFDAAGIDQDFTDSILREMNFNDEVLASTDPESKAVIGAQIAGSVGQTVISIATGMGPAAMFALYGTQGAGGNIETYRQLARNKGFDPDIGEQAMVGLGGMVIAGGLGATLTGKTVGQLPFVKSFQEGGERAMFQAANQAGLFQNVTRDNLFNMGLQAMTTVMRNPQRIKEAAKAYRQFAVSTGTVEGLQEGTEEALNELLFNASVEKYEHDTEQFLKDLAFSAGAGFVGGAAIGPTVKRKIRKETQNVSKNLLGLEDIAPASREEAAANLQVLQLREEALRETFKGEIPGIIQRDINDIRAKLQAVESGEVDPGEVFNVGDSTQRFTAPLGDLAADARLKGTGFQEAANRSLGSDPIEISDSQKEAFNELDARLRNSNLPTEVVNQILGRVKLSRMKTGVNRRNAITVHDVNETGNKDLHRVVFTNDSDKKSAYDELFHILVDSTPAEYQAQVVSGFNQTYNAKATSYDTRKTRDRIAAKVASIINGDEELPDIDNDFTRLVQNIIDGNFTAVNSNITTADNVGTVQADVEKIQTGIQNGTLRRVEVPGHEGKTTVQDADGNVLEYVVSEDSNGESNGVFKFIGNFPPQQTIGNPNFEGGDIIREPSRSRPESPLQAEAEAIRASRRPGPVDQSEALVLQRPEDRFGINVGGEVENFNELRKEVFRDVQERLRKRNLRPAPIERTDRTLRLLTEGDPQSRADIMAARIERLNAEGRPIPIGQFLEYIRANENVAGLLPEAGQPIRGQTRLSDNGGILLDGQGISEQLPQPTVERNLPARIDGGFNQVPQEGVPESLALQTDVRGSQIPQNGVSQDEIIDRASEVIRRLEAEGRPVPQALLDLITVDAEITDVEPRVEQQQQLAAAPITYPEFLAQTETTPQQFATETRTRLQGLLNEQEVAGLLPPADTDPLTEEEPAPVSTSDPVLSQLAPDVAQNLDLGLKPAIQALISGDGIEGVEPVGQTDAVTGFPLMEVNAETANQLAAAGVAVTGNVQFGEDIVETLPTVISLNPNALLEVSTATTPQEIQQSDQGIDGQTAQAEFVSQVMPALDQPNTVEYTLAEDENGETTRYITKQSLINELENQYGETTDNPGPGSVDIITAGPREFQVTRERVPLEDILLTEMGARAEQVGAVMAALPDSPDKTKLIKATKRVARQLVRQAQGSGRFNQETLNKNLRQLDETLAEINPGIDLTQFTGVVGIEGPADVNTEEGVSEVQAALEAAGQTEPETQIEARIIHDEDTPPVDLSDSDVKAGIRRMRQRAKKSSFVRVDDEGQVEFRSNRERNIDTFVEKAEELAATDPVRSKQTDPETGKDEYVVTMKFHPRVADEIFRDRVAALNNNPVAILQNPRTIDEDKTADDLTAAIQPSYSESVPGPLRAATQDTIKGTKMRANVYVTTSSDVRKLRLNQEANDVASILFRKIQDHAEREAAMESENLGGQISMTDDNGRTVTVIYIDDRNVDLNSKEALATLSHELGHALEHDVLLRPENDEAYQELGLAHKQFVEESMDKTLFEFLSEQRVPSNVTSGIDMEYAKVTTMRQMKNDPKMTKQFSYFTRFDEWFADQFSRWALADKKPEVSKATGNVFKSLEKKFRSLFNRFFKRAAFSANKTFENWMNEHVTMSREAENNFFAGDTSIERATNIAQEDSMSLQAATQVPPQEANFRNQNQFEFSVNGELANLRDEIPDWLTLEQAVRNGRSAADNMATPEMVRKARHYENLYAASIALANRPAPPNLPLDVYASYSTSSGIFPERFNQRMEEYWDQFRNSTFNQIRRQLLSPVITRMQIVTGNHPEIQALQELQNLTFASAAQRVGGDPFVDKVNQEITLRTGRISDAIRPIYEAFGYTNTGIQRAIVGATRGAKLADASKKILLGIRDKDFVKEDLATEYNGTTLEEIIDKVREEMDDLRDYAVSKGLITEDEFITYPGSNGREHYVPRIYEQETVQKNFAHFKTQIIERNLRRVYRKEAYIEFLQETNPTRLEGLTEQQLNDIDVPSTFEIKDPDGEIETMISQASEQIAANIAFGRTASFAKQFNPESFSGHETFSKILDGFGTIVPDRMKRRKLFFVPDAELLGQVEVDGKKINFLETNIVSVLSKTVSQIVKRGEYNDIYEGGKKFKDAYDALKEKQRQAEASGDSKLSESIQYDLEAIEALYESVAEVVDLSTHKSVQHGPVRGLLSSLSRISTMSVMGLSSILAIVELGNVPLRVGLVPGMKAILGEGTKLGAAKLANWPGAALGLNNNYTSKMERELELVGYLHRVGEDFSAKVRMDNPFDQDASGAFGGRVPGGEQQEGKALQVGRNLTTAIEYLEDVFYKATMLEGITRVTQVVAAHAADDLIQDIIDTSDKGDLNSAQLRELERLGFVNEEGKFDKEAFDDYKNFHKGLQRARSQGREAIEEYAKANQDQFRGTHYRVTTRLITQMIARPNVVTRPKWGNSKNPIKRMMYRLRSFTYGYRELAFRFYSDEFKNVLAEEGAWGIARMLSRLLPLLFFAGLSIVARAELQAGIHESMGNTEQAKRIRTLQENKTAMDFMIEAFDKSGFTLQGSEGIGAVTGLKYGNSIFSTIGGVGASKIEALAEKSMKTYQTGDPSFLWNEMVELAPGANIGVWDGLQISSQKSDKQYKSDADYFGMLNYSGGF